MSKQSELERVKTELIDALKFNAVMSTKYRKLRDECLTVAAGVEYVRQGRVRPFWKISTDALRILSEWGAEKK